MIEILATLVAWWLLLVAGATVSMALIFAFGLMFMGDDDEK